MFMTSSFDTSNSLQTHRVWLKLLLPFVIELVLFLALLSLLFEMNFHLATAWPWSEASLPGGPGQGPASCLCPVCICPGLPGRMLPAMYWKDFVNNSRTRNSLPKGITAACASFLSVLGLEVVNVTSFVCSECFKHKLRQRDHTLSGKLTPWILSVPC
jgi:hypothetical protein